MHPSRSFVLALLLTVTTQGFAQAPSDQLPSIDQLKESLAAGKTPEVMRGVNRLLALKGPTAAAFDRYELFMLRGEGYIRLKQMPPAAEAFAAAQKETTDDHKKAIARGTELLVRQSKATGYTPRTPATRPVASQPATPVKPGSPIPIVEPESRKAAFEALLNDATAQIQPKIAAAQAAKTLVPLVDAIKQVSDLRAIELAADDSDEKAKQVGSDLAGHAHDLISAALRDLSIRVDAICRDASQKQFAVNPTTLMQVETNTGPTYAEDQELKNIIATCDRIIQFAGDLSTFVPGTQLQQDVTEAKTLRDKATNVPRRDFTNTTGTITTPIQTPTRIQTPIVPTPRTTP